MKVIKVIGNNVVHASRLGKEVICTGRGIGFGLKKGDRVPENKVEKTFELFNPRVSGYMRKMVYEIPEEYWNITYEIECMVEKEFGQKLNVSFYIAMLDHIFAAVKRVNKGISIPPGIVLDLRGFYQREFHLANEIVMLMENHFSVKFPKEEAAFIVLHLFDAELDMNVDEREEISKLAKDVLDIVKINFKVKENSLSYKRFLNHLRFFLLRVVHRTETKDMPIKLYNQLRAEYTREYEVVRKISAAIKENAEYLVTESEEFYLMLHLIKITHNLDDK